MALANLWGEVNEWEYSPTCKAFATGIPGGSEPLWQHTESLQMDTQQMAVLVHSMHLSKSLLLCDFKLMLFIPQCLGVVGPACIMEQDSSWED